MTTLTYAISRAIGRELGTGDEIVLTRLDHDANVSPWRALEERGVRIHFVNVHQDNCTLDMEDLAEKTNENTKLVAVGYASNAVGTINDVKEITRIAHQVGAMTYIDAVHYASHAHIDVCALDCDFLVCSTYKFFGPHMGVLYGKREHLKRLSPYKVRANTDNTPNCWEWGTLNHECIAGITACVDYLASIGRKVDRTLSSRRDALRVAYIAIQEHERGLMRTLIAGLLTIRDLKVYGIIDSEQFDQRCPTIAIRIHDHSPRQLAEQLGDRGFFVWDGHFYALNLAETLGLENDGGFLRIGLTHYNTHEEVRRFLIALTEIASH
jgi:cysteine desulfurase family protein (TIGR01976 family)